MEDNVVSERRTCRWVASGLEPGVSPTESKEIFLVEEEAVGEEGGLK